MPWLPRASIVFGMRGGLGRAPHHAIDAVSVSAPFWSTGLPCLSPLTAADRVSSGISGFCAHPFRRGGMYFGASHILLVDDEESFRYAASRALEDAGYNVVAAEDYRDALVRLEGRAPIDLLVSDIVMPDRVHGFALARMARMRRRDLKVLYVTAYDIPSDEALGKVLRKPLADAELV